MPASEETNDTGRIEAFSDGVFAIAITLLVLEFRPPTAELNDRELLGYLRDQWPVFFAFLTSFATIGITWLNHHRLFTMIQRTDHNLLVLNLLLLLLISFVPYPTALLADYITDPTQHVAAVLYSLTFTLIAICFNILWRYASKDGRLLGVHVDQQEVAAVTRQYRYGPLLYVLILILAFIYVPASITLILLLALFFAIPQR